MKLLSKFELHPTRSGKSQRPPPVVARGPHAPPCAAALGRNSDLGFFDFWLGWLSRCFRGVPERTGLGLLVWNLPDERDCSGNGRNQISKIQPLDFRFVCPCGL